MALANEAQHRHDSIELVSLTLQIVRVLGGDQPNASSKYPESDFDFDNINNRAGACRALKGASTVAALQTPNLLL